MISPASTTLLVVSAILLALQCVNCAPGSEISEIGKRTARYIVVGQPKENSAEVKQYNNYGNNAGDNGNYPGNNPGNGNYNNVNDDYNNAGNNINNVGNMPLDNQSINNGNSVINNGSQIDDNGLIVTAEQPPQHVGFGAVMSAFWDMVLAFIRGSMGIKRREPPRIARAIIGAAVGNDECLKASTCHAGRMMRALDNNAVYFTAAEMLASDNWKPIVRRVRRATEDKEDCNMYRCDV